MDSLMLMIGNLGLGVISNGIYELVKGMVASGLSSPEMEKRLMGAFPSELSEDQIRTVVELAKKSSETQQTFNVTSHQQSGGVTAGIYNQYGKPPRIFNPETQKSLLEKLSNLNIKNVRVSAVMGDTEAFSFAQQIANYLKSKPQLQVDGVDQVFLSGPFWNQDVKNLGNGSAEITIGTQS